MKTKIVAFAVALVFLFSGFGALNFAQEKNVKKEIKQKTETMKQDVKKKTEEGMKNQTQTGVKKVEKSKENMMVHKKHRVAGEKIKQKKTKSITK